VQGRTFSYLYWKNIELLRDGMQQTHQEFIALLNAMVFYSSEDKANGKNKSFYLYE
jgi:hypothetical protein